MFPSGYKRDIKYGQPDPPQQILRTETVTRIGAADSPSVIVASPEALAEKVIDRRSLDEARITVKRGDSIPVSDLVKRLLDLGFSPVEYVYEPGQFARRGSILDVYSYSGELPYRIDYFGDEIDSIRTFDIETQLSEEKRDSVTIVAPGTSERASGVSLPEFLGKDTVIVCRDPEGIMARVRAICSEEFSPNALHAGEGDPEAMKKLVDPDAFCGLFASMKTVRVSATEPPRSFAADVTLRFDCTLQTLYHKNFDLISESFKRLLDEGYRIFILSDSEHQIDRLRAIFDDRGDSIEFTPVLRTVHEGFSDNGLKLCFFTDHQIFDRFHNYSLRSDKARGGKLALSIKELNQIEVGDYIVHIDHGIGRFGGLVKTSVNGKPQEMIKLYYQNNDLVLVSIHGLHKLSKYRGKDGVPPKISRLGSGAWTRLKERTKS